MEIENLFDFILYTVFTIGVVFVVVPMGINYTIAGVRYAKLYGFGLLPENLAARKFGKSAAEFLAVGVLALAGSLRYLFIDQGGNLSNYLSQASQYLEAQ